MVLYSKNAKILSMPNSKHDRLFIDQNDSCRGIEL